MNLSPLLFNIYIHVIVKIFEPVEGADFLFYADDTVFISKDFNKLRDIMNKFMKYAMENLLKLIFFSRTKMMKFYTNGGGGVAAADYIYVERQKKNMNRVFHTLAYTFRETDSNSLNTLHILLIALSLRSICAKP
jgi:hypothetical protein